MAIEATMGSDYAQEALRRCTGSYRMGGRPRRQQVQVAKRRIGSERLVFINDVPGSFVVDIGSFSCGDRQLAP